MKEIKVVLYGEPVNNAVLRMPGREFPGVLVQGDTLRNLVETSESVVNLAKKFGEGPLLDEAEGLAEMLTEICSVLDLEVARSSAVAGMKNS